MPETTSLKKAVVLLSGGLDSATTLYAARAGGYFPHALTIRYGQRHGRETECARWLAADLKIELRELCIDLPWKGSAFLDRGLSLPQSRSEKEMNSGIPATYVPARNTIFLSFALSWAEVLGAEAVFIGANALDYSGYPDCRPEYFQTVEELFKKGTKAGAEGRTIRVETPLLHKTKGEIVQWGHTLGVPFERTWSCYEGSAAPCGVCDSCQLREKGFREAGLADPLLSASR